MTPIRKFVRATAIKPPFDGVQKGAGEPILAASIGGLDARQLVELLMRHARSGVRAGT
jgi:hypothetical protein